MNTLRTLVLLVLAACAPAVLAQVPAMAAAASDAPMPPEPGQRTTTDRTLDPSEARFAQAYAPTLSEQQQMAADVQRLDQDYARMERNHAGMSAADWSALQQAHTTAHTRYDAMSTADAAARAAAHNQVMQDYAAYNRAVYRAQLRTADPAAYARMVNERMAWYDTRLNGYDASAAPDNMRAEEAYHLIQLRHRYDALATQRQRLRRAPVTQRDAMRRQFSDDLAGFDSDVRTATMGMDMTAGSMGR